MVGFEDLRYSIDKNVRKFRPVFGVVINHERYVWIDPNISNPSKFYRDNALRLLIDSGIEGCSIKHVANGDHRGSPDRISRSQTRDAMGIDELTNAFFDVDGHVVSPNIRLTRLVPCVCGRP